MTGGDLAAAAPWSAGWECGHRDELHTCFHRDALHIFICFPATSEPVNPGKACGAPQGTPPLSPAARARLSRSSCPGTGCFLLESGLFWVRQGHESCRRPPSCRLRCHRPRRKDERGPRASQGWWWLCHREPALPGPRNGSCWATGVEGLGGHGRGLVATGGAGLAMEILHTGHGRFWISATGGSGFRSLEVLDLGHQRVLGLGH